ncbi:MAG: hypothetical protein HWD61_01160 [Parachlamydiaceae bacterium]|nr:MAG: hypothetical protein HWD61_01160 [Parachlamydiaceae bacterium]
MSFNPSVSNQNIPMIQMTDPLPQNELKDQNRPNHLIGGRSSDKIEVINKKDQATFKSPITFNKSCLKGNESK